VSGGLIPPGQRSRLEKQIQGIQEKIEKTKGEIIQIQAGAQAPPAGKQPVKA
jgi:hypothetical protein